MTASRSGTRWGWGRDVPGALLSLAAVGGGLLVLTANTVRGSAEPLPALTIDPNQAPPAALRALPRIGPKLAERIIEARESAPFQSVEDLDQRVRGLGPVTIAQLRPYLRIDPPEDGGTVKP